MPNFCISFLFSFVHGGHDYLFYNVCRQWSLYCHVKPCLVNALLDLGVFDIVAGASNDERFEICNYIVLLVRIDEHVVVIIQRRDVLASFVPVGDRHVQVKDYHIEHFLNVLSSWIEPLLDDCSDVLLDVRERFVGGLQCLKTVRGRQNFDVKEFQDGLHHECLTKVVICQKATQLYFDGLEPLHLKGNQPTLFSLYLNFIF
jgi:hypothetical protein